MERISENLAIDLAVRVANTRTAWLCIMRFLLHRGFLTEAELKSMRETCLDAAADFAASGDGSRREFGIAGMRDLDGLFRNVLR